MKVVRIITRLNVGGPAKHVVWLSRRFSESGDGAVLISGEVPAGERDMHYFAEMHSVDPVYVRGLSRELTPRDALSIIRIYRRLLSEKPDIVHTHTAKAGTIGRLAALLYRWLTPSTLIGRPRRVKVVHTFHGNVFHSYYGRGKTTIFKIVERMLSMIATDRIVVLSEQQMDEINRGAGVGRRENFRIIPLGMDLDEFNADRASLTLRREIGASQADVLIGFVGRLTEIKDVALLLRAISRLAVPSVRLIVIGDGGLRPELERQAAELGITEVVSFLGDRRDTAQLVAQLDIVALTSLNEGTPLSLIEAMAAGTPVISTLVGGVVNLLGSTTRTGDGFIVCERGIGVGDRDPEHFASGLRYLAEDADVRNELSTAASEYVRREHSLDRLERDLRSLYTELLNA